MPTLVHDSEQIDFDRPGKHHYQVAFHLDGSWGYSLVPLTVINGRSGATHDSVICFGGTHGNEYEGQIAVKRLCADLDPDQMAGRVVIDIHSGGKEGAFPICTSFHPIPDPAQQAETARAAQLFDTPFVFIYASSMASGLLTDEAEAEGKITLGGEFGGGETTSRLGVRHAYEGTLNVLRHYGLLEGEIRKIRPPEAPPQQLVKADQLDYYVPCPRDGVWEPVVDLGALVREGDLIGRLHDFSDHGAAAVEIRARRCGYIAMMHLSARPSKGQTLYVVADPVDWSEVIG
jgi:predicted deacylase